ncbi:MAG: diacylglycerol kinase family protein [Hyphomicrobiales bacterium]
MAARLKSFSYAFNGIKTLIHGEHNAWLHLASTLVIITMAFALKITASDWRWIILSIALVWFAEAFNTAIERLCNVVSRDFHEGIKASKDLAAGAVLICAIFAAVIGIVTLTPYLISPNEVPAFFDDICRTFL